jgi:hypothetical protein
MSSTGVRQAFTSIKSAIENGIRRHPMAVNSGQSHNRAVPPVTINVDTTRLQAQRPQYPISGAFSIVEDEDPWMAVLKSTHDKLEAFLVSLRRIEKRKLIKLQEGTKRVYKK